MARRRQRLYHHCRLYSGQWIGRGPDQPALGRGAIRAQPDQGQLSQNVTVQAGNSGLIVGTPGDPRMFGITLRGKV
jgi:hypothetical protein